jgi:hypothetical protein
MAIITEVTYRDSETGDAVEFERCACTNDVFYVTTTNQRICACCKMTGAEAQAAKDAADAEQATIDNQIKGDIPDVNA